MATENLSILIKLGKTYTGLSLKAQLVDTSGSDRGASISSGFVELEDGEYLWTYGFDTTFQGAVKILKSDGTYLTSFGLNPDDSSDYSDILNQILRITQSKRSRR